jgi:hypothetical protein
MKRRGFQISPPHRLTLYGVSLLLLLSGGAWAWIHHLDETGRAGEVLRRTNSWLLKAHGYAAIGFVLLLGTLIPVHIQHCWHACKNRLNGTFFLGAASLLTLSGYTLYYLGDEAWRNGTSQFHLWLGLAAPALLLFHIRAGRKATGRK